MFIAVATANDVIVRELALDGSPEEILEQTASAGTALVEEILAEG